VFLATVGNQSPATQAVEIRNPGTQQFQLSANVTDTSNIWSVETPADLNVPPGTSKTVTVAANSNGLPGGTYRSKLNIQTGAGNPVTVVDLLLIVRATAAARDAGADPRQATPVCPPGGLQIVAVNPGMGFRATDAAPFPVELLIYDQAGAPFTTGFATASFTGAATGAASLAHIGSEPGRWIGTLFPPPQARTTTALRILAADPNRNVSGCIEMPGTIQTTNAPVIYSGGIGSPATFAPGAPGSPGGMVAIFGTNLAAGSNSAQGLPLPLVLSAARATLGGQPVSLFFAGDDAGTSQINGIVSYALKPNVAHQLILRRGQQAAYAEYILADAMPGLFTVAQTGTGPAVAVHGANPLSIVSAENPATPGEVIVLYVEGLGAVDTPVTAGTQSPASPLARAAHPVTVTIGGIPAEVSFAGLTPGLAGLYQINVTVPVGVQPDPAVPVVVTVAGQPSAPATIAVQ
jgi:uncharacterized protein (TIGR03437 family)